MSISCAPSSISFPDQEGRGNQYSAATLLAASARIHKQHTQECEARCKMLISSDVKHEHMSAAFHMLAESKMLSAGMPWDLVKDAEEFYQVLFTF